MSTEHQASTKYGTMIIEGLRELYEKQLLQSIQQAREINSRRPETEDFIPPPEVILVQVTYFKEVDNTGSFSFVVISCWLPESIVGLPPFESLTAYIPPEKKELTVKYPEDREDLRKLAGGFSAGFIAYKEDNQFPKVNFLQLIAIGERQTTTTNPSFPMTFEKKRQYFRLAEIVDSEMVKAFKEKKPPFLAIKIGDQPLVFDTLQLETITFHANLGDSEPRAATSLRYLKDAPPLYSIVIDPNNGSIAQQMI